jgi:TM2 domain-containing membrane protein YozV
MLSAMTEPQFSGSESGNPYPPPPPQPGYRPPGQYPPPPGQYPPPAGQYPGAYMDPMAPYGRHPLTGEPLSDKSKTIAGLLQLIGIVGILGIGRIYMGQTGLGVAQLLIGLIGGFVIGILTCGIGFGIPVIWGIIDCIVLMTGSPRDSMGRPLHDGT